MANKIIILKNGYLPDLSVLSEKGKAYILTTQNETVPVGILSIAKGEFEMVYAGDGSDLEYAFCLGKLYAIDGSSKLYTNDDKLRKLFETGSGNALAKTTKRGRKKADAQPSAPSVSESAPLQKKAEDKPESNTDKTASPKAPRRSREKSDDLTSASSNTNKLSELGKIGSGKGTKEKKNTFSDNAMNHPTQPKTTDFAKIKKEAVEKLLSDNKFDIKLAPAVLEALHGANAVTADVMVRTKLAASETVDKNTVIAIGALIKKTYCD